MRRAVIWRAGLGLALLAGVFGGRLQAQWQTQEIPLTGGWNAVFLRVQPEPNACADVLAGLSVEGIWKWNGRSQTIQFTTSPDQLLPRDDDWLVWAPPGEPASVLNTLHAVHANNAYLLRLPADQEPLTWRLKGRPMRFRPNWRSDGLTLTGLPVPPDGATFGGFFQSCDAISLSRADGGQIQAVQPDGQGEPIWTPVRTIVKPGRAYWIHARESTDFAGQLEVDFGFGDSLVFLPEMPERRLSLRNVTSSALPVTVRLLPSEDQPPGKEYAVLAGPVPLARREKDWGEGLPKTVHLPFDRPVSRTVEAGETWTLRLVLRERLMLGDAGDTVRLSLLEISAGNDFREILGVIARR